MHELDFTTGRVGMAYAGETPWHQLGSRLTPGAPLEIWQSEAGLDWSAKRAGVEFDRMIVDVDGKERALRSKSPKDFVLYRSDTGDVLSVVSDRYQPVQPKQIIEFYRDLTDKHGFELETAGSLKGGTRIWALANTKNVTTLRGGDVIKGYLLLATSFDGTMSTQARFTSVRVVCNNTIEIATRGKADITVPHSTVFDADKVKIELQIGDAWAAFSAQAEAMSQRIVSRDESVRYFLDVYFGLDSDEKIKEHAKDEKNHKSVEKFTARIQQSLFESPGAVLASAKGTVWGLLNAVTRDLDYVAPARSQENRLNSSWFGRGASIKARAWDAAARMTA